MEPYLVFVIQAYQSKADNGQLADAVTLELIAKTREEAMDRAKEIIKKDHYRTHMVIEKFK